MKWPHSPGCFRFPSFFRFAALWLVLSGWVAHAADANIIIPDVRDVQFDVFGTSVGGALLLHIGLAVCALGAAFGFAQYRQTKALPVHKLMRAVSETIWETCKTYLFQQGRFLVLLWGLIAICIFYYYKILQEESLPRVLLILAASILGILGSYGVAWFGILINTQANSRSAFAALRGKPLPVIEIPLRSGMSVGMVLVSVELFFMISILMFLPPRFSRPLFHRVRDR